jgi:hypothetical protein
MSVFSSVNAVSVGLATKKDHYDRVFENSLSLQEGSVALTQAKLDGLASNPSAAPAGDAVLVYRSDLDQLLASQSGSDYFTLGAAFPPSDPYSLIGLRHR